MAKATYICRSKTKEVVATYFIFLFNLLKKFLGFCHRVFWHFVTRGVKKKTFETSQSGLITKKMFFFPPVFVLPRFFAWISFFKPPKNPAIEANPKSRNTFRSRQKLVTHVIFISFFPRRRWPKQQKRNRKENYMLCHGLSIAWVMDKLWTLATA
jgi:hypothetical protein